MSSTLFASASPAGQKSSMSAVLSRSFSTESPGGGEAGSTTSSASSDKGYVDLDLGCRADKPGLQLSAMHDCPLQSSQSATDHTSHEAKFTHHHRPTSNGHHRPSNHKRFWKRQPPRHPAAFVAEGPHLFQSPVAFQPLNFPAFPDLAALNAAYSFGYHHPQLFIGNPSCGGEYLEPQCLAQISLGDYCYALPALTYSLAATDQHQPYADSCWYQPPLGGGVQGEIAINFMAPNMGNGFLGFDLTESSGLQGSAAPLNSSPSEIQPADRGATASSAAPISSSLNPNAKSFTPALNPNAKEFRPAVSPPVSSKADLAEPESLNGDLLNVQQLLRSERPTGGAEEASTDDVDAMAEASEDEPKVSAAATDAAAEEDVECSSDDEDDLDDIPTYDSCMYSSSEDEDEGVEGDESLESKSRGNKRKLSACEECSKSDCRHRSLSVCSEESSFIQFNGSSSSTSSDAKRADLGKEKTSVTSDSGACCTGGKLLDSFLVPRETGDSSDSEDEAKDDVDFRRSSFDEKDLAMFQGLVCPMARKRQLEDSRCDEDVLKLSQGLSELIVDRHPSSCDSVQSEEESRQKILEANNAWNKYYSSGEKLPFSARSASKSKVAGHERLRKGSSVSIAPSSCFKVFLEDPEMSADLSEARRSDFQRRQADAERLWRILIPVFTKEHREAMFEKIYGPKNVFYARDCVIEESAAAKAHTEVGARK